MFTSKGKIFSGTQEIMLRGVNWFGFNNGSTSPDGLWSGDALTRDFATVAARMRALGFNAVRLPFSFQDLWELPPKDRSFDDGRLPTPKEIAASVGLTDEASIRRATLINPPRRNGTRCNDYWSGSGRTTLDRFVWCVQFLCRNGFTVLIDNHLREDQTALTDRNLWLRRYVEVIARLTDDSTTAKRLAIDILNEPDEHGLRWEPGDRSLTGLYLDLMDAADKVGKLLYFVEGTGQSGINCNWGDGFCTDGEKIRRMGLSDARNFFDPLLKRPYANRVVLSPHIYGPAVTHNTNAASGPALFDRLSTSFGELTLKGYGDRVFAVAPGEFGSKFEKDEDKQTMQDLARYFNCEGAGNDNRHTPIRNWFYWCWNANSGDTGGIVKDDWKTLQDVKVKFLRGLRL